MTAALFDTADLLARCKRDLNRPTSDEALADADWYAYLTEAQSRVVRMLAAHAPESMYSAPTKLTTADSGLTYSFGTDLDSAQIFGFGHVELRAAPKGRMILPGNDWDDTTERFIIDGAKIRWPGQRTRTFGDGPYARFIAPPNIIDATHEPTLQPVFARILLVSDACARASEKRLKQDPTPFQNAFNRDWIETLHALKTRHFGEGLRSQGTLDQGLWFRNSW